ncbi:MAG: hypothetical protein AABW81_04150 [Nanoarchaeota archaeon]
MTKDLEKLAKSFNDLNKYEFGNVAIRALSQDDISTSVGALKQLASDFGNGADYEAFVDYTLSSEDGIKKASSVYGKKFREVIEGIQIGDLYGKRYNSILTSYLSGDNLSKAEKVLTDFKENTYGSIVKKYSQAEEILKSNTGNFTEDQKIEAKKTKDKYKSIVSLLNLLETAKYEELRPKAVKNSLKLQFNDYVDSLTRA